MPFSTRLDRLGTGVFARNDIRKQKYRIQSNKNHLPDLIDLSLGSSDLLPPDDVVQEISKALFLPESSSYCLHAATRPFREEVASWCKRRLGESVDPEKEVLLLVGSQEGTAHLPLAVMNPGELGLILDPSYPSHKGGLILADAKIQRLLLESSDNWKPDFNSLSIANLDKLKMITFGFPHNPTAQVGEQEWLDEAMNLGRRHEIVIAHDNPYLDLAIDHQAPSLLRSPGWREWGIEFFSFSKGWSMGGFRLAFAIGAEPLVTALKSIKDIVDFNQTLALQSGAIVALSKYEQWPKYLLVNYKERRDKVLESLKDLGWDIPVPSMALYLWMPMPAWAINRDWNDEFFAAELLAETGVALTPGSGFGLGGSDWLRLALVRPVEELEEAIFRIRPWWNAQS